MRTRVFLGLLSRSELIQENGFDEEGCNFREFENLIIHSIILCHRNVGRRYFIRYATHSSNELLKNDVYHN